MKLYHYVAKPNNALKKGILSFAKNPESDLTYYIKRSGVKTHAGIVKWMEKCFKGRSRGIRVLIEPLQYTRRTLQGIKGLIDSSDLFEIDVSALEKDGLIEAIYVSPSVLEKEPENQDDEALYRLTDLSEIDFTPNDYSILDDAKGRRFAFLRYYLLIVKGGAIPPKYIKLIK